MTGFVQVTAFRCELCLTVHAKELSAQKCCTCKKCGLKFKSTSGIYRQSECPHCLWSIRVVAARKSVRDAKARLANAEVHLKTMLAIPRPKKCAPENEENENKYWETVPL